MDHVGIDLGKRQSHACAISAETGEIRHRRIPTSPEGLTSLFERLGLGRCRILLEASACSEWVARHLEGLGHEVIVGDPNYAPMYGERTRRVKTDRRDAEALAEACLKQNYRPAHRLSDDARRLRARLAGRTTLVKSRAECARRVGTELWHHGLRLRSGSMASLRRRVDEVAAPSEVREVLEPLLEVVEQLSEKLAELEAELKREAVEREELRRFTTIPWIGVVISHSFLATVDTPERFASAAQLTSYLGLVPREWSSSEIQRRGSITKTGDKRLRSHLVQAAWLLLTRPATEQTRALQRWAERIAQRRGKKKAVIALARKLVRILYAMWRDGRDFEPSLLRIDATAPAAS